MAQNPRPSDQKETPGLEESAKRKETDLKATRTLEEQLKLKEQEEAQKKEVEKKKEEPKPQWQQALDIAKAAFLGKEEAKQDVVGVDGAPDIGIKLTARPEDQTLAQKATEIMDASKQDNPTKIEKPDLAKTAAAQLKKSEPATPKIEAEGIGTSWKVNSLLARGGRQVLRKTKELLGGAKNETLSLVGSLRVASSMMMKKVKGFNQALADGRAPESGMDTSVTEPA